MTELRNLPFSQVFTQNYCAVTGNGKITIAGFPCKVATVRKFDDKSSMLYTCRNGKNLYFLFKRKLTKAGVRKFEKKPPLWRDDTAELFLDTGHSENKYYHFIVNPLNKRECNYMHARATTCKWSRDSHCRIGPGIKWSSFVKLTKNEFNVLMVIPLDGLKLTEGKEGAIWGVNALLHKAAEGKSTFFEDFRAFSCHTPWAFDELIFTRVPLKIKSLHYGNVEMGAPNTLVINAVNTGKKAAVFNAKVTTYYDEDLKEYYSDSVLFNAKAGEAARVTLPYFLHPGSNCLRSTHKVEIEIKDCTGKSAYTRQAIFGYAKGFPLYYGKPAGKPVSPELSDSDFLNNKRSFIISKLPRFERWRTPDGAPSDFCVRSTDKVIVFNLMRPDALKKIAEFIHKNYDNDIDRLLGANMLLHDPAFMTYHASTSYVGGRLFSPLSIIRFGAGGCDTFSEALLGLVENLRIGKTKKCYTGRVLGLSGHIVTAVRYKGREIVLDPSMGTFFYRWDNKEPASVEELLHDPALVDRGGISYSKDFFREEKTLSRYGYRDVIWP